MDRSPTLPLAVNSTTTSRLSSAYLDVINEIRLDHGHVRDLFDSFETYTDADKKALVDPLIRKIAIHRDAGKVSVYSKYRRLMLGDTEEHDKGTRGTRRSEESRVRSRQLRLRLVRLRRRPVPRRHGLHLRISMESWE